LKHGRDNLQFKNDEYEIPKGEGVSGLVRKCDWMNWRKRSIFAPASWEDMDLFLRMIKNGFTFILTGASMVWHFGARGSHRLEENNGVSSPRQKDAEQQNIKKWLEKWGTYPTFNEYGMINGIQ
jgi:hypothetical protein